MKDWVTMTPPSAPPMAVPIRHCIVAAIAMMIGCIVKIALLRHTISIHIIMYWYGTRFLYYILCSSILQLWNGSFFERIALKTLGLKIQLGHPIGTACPSPTPTYNDDFTIINDNGIHQVSLMYCGCQKALRPTIQLLRARLFPSTTIEPRTAATFRVLETFQMLSFTAKTTALDFYKALEARTDNTGTNLPPVRTCFDSVAIIISMYIYK